ncbi:sigma-54-dependent transcriptional regulator [Acidihalobacter ferrooxydans]|uniref:Sigma-54-dependent Fis family transcriptional regulator n=1 Tax=Acidihalobacter ferrooxydans TaxID=1765967 RepID=A0A1P8UDQ9_9GAMM|nr:sigma-54 dependent transcriptional regulator [Acidihalobacter ferrooxydans]APZ41950.1 hypothetical protein BW247_01590 [Acidihalobacter ferrooxydans]
MRILIVDDEQPLRDSLRYLLEAYGHQVVEALDIQDARSVLRARCRRIDVMLLDLFFQDAPDGLALLEELTADADAPPVIVTSGTSAVAHAVRALKLGARDYLTKPVDPDELRMRLAYIEQSIPSTHADTRIHSDADCIRFDKERVLVCRSPAMKALLRRVEHIVEQNFPVLIQGETGVGKGLLARLMHAFSPRAQAPFVAVNCSAIPPELAEAELFGHYKGSFTGASTTRIGLLQQANGGTLFLDEIGELTPALQSKLLTALEDGQIRPIGAHEPVDVDIRLLCATNRDLAQETRTGTFRADLYYRISTVALTIPPLRERVEDIRPITEIIVNELRHSFNREYATLDPATLRALEHHDWPGNVRELRNVLVRSMVEMNGIDLHIDDADLHPGDNGAQEPQHPTRDVITDAIGPDSAEILTLEEIERRYAQTVLNRLGGNKLATAKALGISRGTLRRKLEETD